MKDPKRMNELFQDPGFKEKSSALKTAEDMQKLLKEYGVDYSLDDVYQMCEEVALYMENADNKDGELSEDSLEAVSGGFWGALAFAVVCIGTFALGVYNGYKETKKPHT